ncbi:MAG TPA: TlpA family protein disulfide reductase [Gemmatimonadetes bacterium]|jgi:thiol-disulfide isomerase/thioredoxin|nr:TlpA family protein disulfide reductase [Gemmatimonadota bacterium]HIK98653.1 TlpA family protein disulfide reductase [Dehalococcoidia bacterium]
MRQSKTFTVSLLLMCLASPLAVVAQSGSLVSEMSDLAWAGEVDKAHDLLEARRVDEEQPTPEWLAAVSWMARGASFAKRWELAEQYAGEAYEGSLELMKERPLDAERFLPTALGAGIEVLGHTYDAQGDRARAVTFLGSARQEFAGTSIETRIQKNFLLLSLEGERFPALEVDDYLGIEPPTPDDLKGKVVVFFFWAHWCPDCKRQEPILTALHDEYSDQGLVIVGPTQLYGFVSRGQNATPEEELAYLNGDYTAQFPIPPFMSVPISTSNFLNFGVSTTPTLVLVDRDGIVQRYNPGDLSHEELAALIEPLLQ